MDAPTPRRLRLLLVDDQEGDLLLLRSLLREIPGWSCELDWACTLDEAAAAVRARGPYDACLLDYRLGPCTGLDVRRELVALGCRAPMLILTGFGEPALDRLAMREGAADFLEKQQLTPALLARAIDHALTRERLAGAARMSELGALAAGMAHELNNLDAIILGALERVLDRPGLEEGSRRQLEVVRGAATRAAALARSLLAFARGREDGVAPASLTRVARETLELVQGVLAADGVSVRSQLEDVPPMPMQAAAVGQVVMNLLLNARDALRGRPAPLIEISCRASAAHALLEVRDNGCGIAEHDLPRVFEPFFSTKCEQRAAALAGGAGLGLSLCRTIVERHGGEIAVRSEPGGGSEFTVRLPLAQPAVAHAAAPPTEARVLIVEDEAALRELWREVLTETGWHTLEAETGEAALALLADHPVDVVLADLHLTDISGLELVRRLRERAPAIVAISGAELEPEVAAQVEAALAKPVELATIRATLAAALHRRRATTA